jgi:hypothetical protein
MRIRGLRGVLSCAMVLILTGVCLPNSHAMAAKGKARKWRVPIVMEKATVRGKIVILETRVEERRTIQSLRVQIWTWKESLKQKTVRDKLLHETKTDRDGFFSLPVVDSGNYLLVIGDLHLKLTVVPPAAVKQDQQEPKILLILLPKEVI